MKPRAQISAAPRTYIRPRRRFCSTSALVRSGRHSNAHCHPSCHAQQTHGWLSFATQILLRACLRRAVSRVGLTPGHLPFPCRKQR